MSDGTLKLFVYYLLLHEKNPRQLVFIEEPENGFIINTLHLLGRMRQNVLKMANKQLFITTTVRFCKCVSSDDVWVLSKGDDGFSTIKRASDYNFVKDLAAEGVNLGDMVQPIFWVTDEVYIQFLVEDTSTGKNSYRG